MRPAVDDVDLMKRDSMDNFFPFLQLTFRALHKSSLLSSGIVVPGSCKRTTKPTNLSYEQFKIKLDTQTEVSLPVALSIVITSPL